MARKSKRNAELQLLRALACGATVEGAARQSDVSESTVYRRLRDPEFRKQIDNLRSEMVQRTAGTLTAAGSESVKTLVVLQQPTNAGAVRLGAAKAVLELGIKIREVADLEQRMAALEEQLLAQQATT